jgi:tetraprenyl-beta-curcumene synthase
MKPYPSIADGRQKQGGVAPLRIETDLAAVSALPARQNTKGLSSRFRRSHSYPGASHSPRRLRMTFVLVAAWLCYWLTIFPRVRRELRLFQRHAQAIPDPTLRRLALQAQAKQGNILGASLFAVFASRRHRGDVVRAAVAYQSAYNYLDLLSEQPSDAPVDNGRSLHQALLVALDPRREHPDYYKHHPQRDDNGYLAGMIDTCRNALSLLPSYEATAQASRRAAQRILTFQSLNLSEVQGDHTAFEHWAREQTPNGSGLQWWETAASGGSSLGIYALMAAAGDRIVRAPDVAAIEDAYFPWIGALHSLLDGLVDVSEDAAVQQPSLLGYYSSETDAAASMRRLAIRSEAAVRKLGRTHRHRIILAVMISYYLSASQASATQDRLICDGVLDGTGRLTKGLTRAMRIARAAGCFSYSVGGRSKD